MNDFMDRRGFERRLETGLLEEADRFEELGGRELHLDEVLGRAGGLRRRRRTVTGLVAAAAVVALIAPAGVILADRDSASGPAPLAHPTGHASTVPTANADTGRQPAPGVLDVSDLPTGEAARVDYLQQGTLHLADGGTAAVQTRHTPQEFVELKDGARVWQTVDHGTSYVEVQEPDGTFRDPVRSHFGLSSNPAHTIASWILPSGQVMVWQGGTSAPQPLGDPVPGSDLRIGPVTGADCSLACTVDVNVLDRDLQPWEVTDSGTHPLRDGSYLTVADVSEAGLSVGLTKISDFSTCSTLLGEGEFAGFSTCRNQLTSFSPDGRLILALPSYYDGLGPGAIAMYDLHGKRLFERSSTEQAQSWFTDAVWEDDSHLLVPVFQDGTWSLVRIGTDGHLEYAAPQVTPKGPDATRSPFLLPR
ncbi:MAG TPA: hypothetical protein VFR99_11750 [Marmoricola sp.]|nr:hypothetical protein [Marmoricola sp.]